MMTGDRERDRDLWLVLTSLRLSRERERDLGASMTIRVGDLDLRRLLGAGIITVRGLRDRRDS